MSQLVVVRHGQASFLAENYDVLSRRGEEQAKCLGRHWCATRFQVDEVYTGPRLRQSRTAELIGKCYQLEDLAWPKPVELAAWDEHQIDRVMINHGPALVDMYPEIGPLLNSARSEGTHAERARRFQRVFEAVANRWVAGDPLPGETETWTEFRDRVADSLSHIVQKAGRGRSIAIFTSVGPVTVALQRAMGCDDMTALTTGWRVWNCSLTEFAFSGDRFTLDRFNALPHLPDPGAWTYR